MMRKLLSGAGAVPAAERPTVAQDGTASPAQAAPSLRARRISSSLVVRFLILSLLSVALVSLASSYFLSRFLTERMLALDVQLTGEFINNIFGIETADHDFSKDNGEIKRGELAAFFQHMARMPEVLRSNIYTRDGTMLWSTDKSLVGRRFTDNDELNEAAEGKALFALGITGQQDKDEHVDLGEPGRPFVENYIPIYRDGRIGNEVLGVAEIYRTPQPLLAAIRDGRQLVFIAAGIGTFLIIATQCWLVGHADRVIRRQAAAIASNERLATAGEMAAAVAHGLRNPLASIRSSAELGLRQGKMERVAPLLDDIILQSDRLEHWIWQYLHVAEPEPAHPTPLAPVLASVHANFATELERRDITWHLLADAALPPVRFGPAILEQVLNGLIANAIQAMPDGGEIKVAVRAETGGAVLVGVQDNGHGMTPEQLDRAFVPFVTTKATGLGLGLPLARRILERHGATIELRSRPGQGTVALLRLPTVA